jgi:multidrug efflux system membrane fusion protein
MKRLIIVAVALVVLAGAGLLGWYVGLFGGATSAGPTGVHGHRRPILHVDTTSAKVRAEPVLLDAVGQVQTEHSVNVHAQVSGMLQKVFFQEGDEVKQGQLLFRIDSAPFKAQVAAAKAALQRDQAALANARAQAKRLAPLAKLDYVTPEEYQNAETTADQAKADIAADEAALKQARIKLAYTKIHSPISGRTGNLNVKAGNIVSANDQTPLVVINQIKPIQVSFSVPQRQLIRIRQFQQQGPLKVMVSQEEDSTTLAAGKLVFINNTVAQQTGTVMLKALFANPKEHLWPGEFVGVQLTLTVEPRAVVVPVTAVQVGQSGNYVFLVKNGKSAIQRITVGRQINGVAIVSAGLNGGERIITHVPRRLEAGMRVKSDTRTAAASSGGGESAAVR